MIYIFLALGFYTAVVLFSSAANKHLNSVFVAALANMVSFILPTIIAASLIARKSEHNNRFGVIMAICAGLSVSVFALAFNKSLADNKVGIVTPILYGGTILLSTVLSYFIFKEKINLTEGIGLLIVLIGLGIIIYARAFA